MVGAITGRLRELPALLALAGSGAAAKAPRRQRTNPKMLLAPSLTLLVAHLRSNQIRCLLYAIPVLLELPQASRHFMPALPAQQSCKKRCI